MIIVPRAWQEMNHGLWATPREALTTLGAVAGLISTLAGLAVKSSEGAVRELRNALEASHTTVAVQFGPRGQETTERAFPDQVPLPYSGVAIDEIASGTRHTYPGTRLSSGPGAGRPGPGTGARSRGRAVCLGVPSIGCPGSGFGDQKFTSLGGGRFCRVRTRRANRWAEPAIPRPPPSASLRAEDSR
jgi:hypothetical protein